MTVEMADYGKNEVCDTLTSHPPIALSRTARMERKSSIKEAVCLFNIIKYKAGFPLVCFSVGKRTGTGKGKRNWGKLISS